jgi:L-seryl-tRNA(Ser) seleniumtransferase
MANDDTSAASAYRHIPAVNRLVDELVERGWAERVGRAVVTDAARTVTERCRAEIARGEGVLADSVEAIDFIALAESVLASESQYPLRPAINATGIILHTGLGRAPMAAVAVEAMADVARSYAPVELDMPSGERGKRADIVRDLLRGLTGAEWATVVNNNTAAIMMILNTLARGLDVIVSRGELIEIGGSFRLPDVIRAAGANLREVGTTNKTKLEDYERAIDDGTGAIMKLHPSNYRIEGFTHAPTVEGLAALGQEHFVPVVYDTGSGVLTDATNYGLPGDEPDAASAIAAGADLVLFSGDKLLGGPQAGVIVGRRELIEQIEANPLMRAVRVDKLTLAALGVTLQIHRDPSRAVRDLPIYRALATSMDQLNTRAARLVERLDALDGVASARLHEATAYMGGGSTPALAVPSMAIELRTTSLSDEELARRLRAGDPPIVARRNAGALWLDLRTISPEHDDRVFAAIESALSAIEGDRSFK